MIVWQGKGWLVAVIVFGCSLLANLITNSVTGSEDYWNQSLQPFAISLVIAGGICWSLGMRLEQGPTRTLVDEATGERFELKHKHTFFWIPVKWCGLIAFLGAIAIVAYEVLRGIA